MSEYDDRNWQPKNGHSVMVAVMRYIGGAADYMHKEVVRTGFYEDVNPDDPRHVACVAALTAGEVHEMIDAVRAPEPAPAPKIGGDFTHEEEEAADVFIRHLDYCAWREIRLGEAVVAKLGANRRRGHRHGGKRF